MMPNLKQQESQKEISEFYDYELINENSDLRDKLLANLRNNTKRSKTEMYINVMGTTADKRDRSISSTEPQSVLIKNRSEHLKNKILQLRSKYADLLAEESNK